VVLHKEVLPTACIHKVHISTQHSRIYHHHFSKCRQLFSCVDSYPDHTPVPLSSGRSTSYTHCCLPSTSRLNIISTAIRMYSHRLRPDIQPGVNPLNPFSPRPPGDFTTDPRLELGADMLCPPLPVIECSLFEPDNVAPLLRPGEENLSARADRAHLIGSGGLPPSLYRVCFQGQELVLKIVCLSPT
jgi:hypothetical protein